MAQLNCPNPAELGSYAKDRAALGRATTLDGHLLTCRACLDRYLTHIEEPAAPEVPGCQIVAELGRGRFGIVYKAWRVADEPQLVALKVLSSFGDMEKDRFDREVAALKRIDSPWIVKCIDSGMAAGSKYLTMDYINGVHLDEYVADAGISTLAKLHTLECVCRAVASAHQVGVIHRDLKPKNILVDAQGQPHVLDFGICSVNRVDWTSWHRHTITHVGDLIGTLKYMSPEQAWGGVAGHPDERSDVWALGLMLHEVVTGGGYPYSMRSTPDRPAHEALLDRIRTELPQLPKLDGVERGRDLETLLERTLTWERADRLRSAKYMADDLERYRHGQPIRTKPMGMFYRLRRLAVGAATRSHWMLLVLMAMTIPVLVWVSVTLFMVGWQVSGLEYRAGSAATSANSTSKIPQVLIVGVDDESPGAVLEYAAAAGMEGVTAKVPTWRGIHGQLMQRLATAQPRVVVWDYYFKSPRQEDQAFLVGLEALERTGIPVVCAARNYAGDGAPDLSPDLLNTPDGGLRHGVIFARDMVERPGEFVLAIVRPNGVIIPSVALTVSAAYVHPEARMELEYAPREKWLDAYYRVGPSTYLRESDQIGLTLAVKALQQVPLVHLGDILACSTFPLKEPTYWERHTVSYQHLLGCDPDELNALVAGRVVLIGDLRKARPGFGADRHSVQYASLIVENVPGCYLLADAISGLLNQKYIRAAWPLPFDVFAVLLLVALIGGLAPSRLIDSTVWVNERTRQICWMTLLVLASVAFWVMLTSRDYVTIHLAMICVCLFASASGAFWIEFVRNRHRILDRSWSAISRHFASTDGAANGAASGTASESATGTATLTSQRGR